MTTNQKYSHPRFDGWGIYRTWLSDNSPISFRKIGETEWTHTFGSRKIGETEWTHAFVKDDHIYYPHHKAVEAGEVYHVTCTTKGNIDFGVFTDGTCSQNRNYEVLLNHSHSSRAITPEEEALKVATKVAAVVAVIFVVTVIVFWST